MVVRRSFNFARSEMDVIAKALDCYCGMVDAADRDEVSALQSYVSAMVSEVDNDLDAFRVDVPAPRKGYEPPTPERFCI